jgi:TonB family protein
MICQLFRRGGTSCRVIPAKKQLVGALFKQRHQPQKPGETHEHQIHPAIPVFKGDPSITSIPPGWQNPGRPGGGAPTDTVGVDKLDRPPRARSQPAPYYPADLRSSGVEGTVVVEFLVDKEGNVHNPLVLRASHPGFIDPAIRAISRWKFEPSHSGGRRVRFRMSVPMVFTIEHR